MRHTVGLLLLLCPALSQGQIIRSGASLSGEACTALFAQEDGGTYDSFAHTGAARIRTREIWTSSEIEAVLREMRYERNGQTKLDVSLYSTFRSETFGSFSSFTRTQSDWIEASSLRKIDAYIRGLLQFVNQGLPENRRWEVLDVNLRYETSPTVDFFHLHPEVTGLELLLANLAFVGGGTIYKDGLSTVHTGEGEIALFDGAKISHMSADRIPEGLILLIAFVRVSNS